MANISDKTSEVNAAEQLHNSIPVTNWISQINAGGTVYDIATHHNIIFKDGSGDTVGTKWNGLTDVEIVIPSITDIVQTPIEFIGTVNASGKVMDGTKEITTFEKGNLVFIAADCTFNGKVCEAGDMAIYDGSEWKVVTGENQVSIAGNNGEAETTIAIGPTKDVLTVEGKKLKLALDYEDLNKHVSVTTGGNDKAPVKFGNMTVGKTYVKLNQADADIKTIGQSITLQKASALADGTVDLKGIETLVTNVTFGTFDAGSLQGIVLNSDDRTFSVTGGSLTYDDTSLTHFVTDVSLDGDVTFGTANEGENGAFSLINGIQPKNDGQSFVTGINGDTNSFIVAGCLQPDGGENSTYIKGITGSYANGLKSGGSFSLTDGSTDIVIGFEDETINGDVISSVSVDTTNKKSVFSGAKVNDHVLSFDTEDVLGDVDITPKYKSLKTTTYNWSPAELTTSSFVNGTFKKSNDATYTINTASETTYEHTTSFYKITTPTISTDKGGYKLSTSGMAANVPANTFGVGVSGGKLPSLTNGSVSWGANVTGTVGTSLTYTNHESFNALTNTTITIPGAYSLKSSDTEGVEVGKAGELSSKNATIDLSEYLTGVSIVTNASNA